MTLPVRLYTGAVTKKQKRKNEKKKSPAASQIFSDSNQFARNKILREKQSLIHTSVLAKSIVRFRRRRAVTGLHMRYLKKNFQKTLS